MDFHVVNLVSFDVIWGLGHGNCFSENVFPAMLAINI